MTRSWCARCHFNKASKTYIREANTKNYNIMRTDLTGFFLRIDEIGNRHFSCHVNRTVKKKSNRSFEKKNKYVSYSSVGIVSTFHVDYSTLNREI